MTWTPVNACRKRKSRGETDLVSAYTESTVITRSVTTRTGFTSVFVYAGERALEPANRPLYRVFS